MGLSHLTWIWPSKIDIIKFDWFYERFDSTGTRFLARPKLINKVGAWSAKCIKMAILKHVSRNVFDIDQRRARDQDPFRARMRRGLAAM